MLAHSINDMERKATVQPAYDHRDYDLEAVMSAARALRAQYFYAWTRQTWRAFADAWRKRRAYGRAFAELQTLSDYELHDIGMSRGDIRVAVYGARLPLSTRLAEAMSRVFARFAAWRRRRHTIVELNSLDDHVLRDIGITRGDITSTVANANHPRTAA